MLNVFVIYQRFYCQIFPSSDHLYNSSVSRVVLTKSDDYEITFTAVNISDSRKNLLLLILTGKGQFAVLHYPKRCLKLM